MIEQGCTYTDSTIKEMTDFFQTKVENLEPKKEKKKSSADAKKTNKQRAWKRKREDFDSSIIESSEESTVELSPNRKYCILHGKFTHSTDNCKDLCAMVSKQK